MIINQMESDGRSRIVHVYKEKFGSTSTFKVFFYSVESLSPVYQQFHILVMSFIQCFRYMYSCKSVRNCCWISLAQKSRLLSVTITRLVLEVGITGSSIEDLDDV